MESPKKNIGPNFGDLSESKFLDNFVSDISIFLLSLFLCVHIYLFRNLCLSLSFLCIFVYPNLFLFGVCAFLSLSVCLCLFVSRVVSVCLCLSLCIPVCRSSLFLCVFCVSLSISACSCLFIWKCLFIFIFVFLFCLFVFVFADRFVKMAYFRIATCYISPF